MDEFEQVQSELKRPNGYRAWWQIIDLTDEQRDALEKAGANPAISHRAIHIVLKKWGHEVPVGSIGHWRRTHMGLLLR